MIGRLKAASLRLGGLQPRSKTLARGAGVAFVLQVAGAGLAYLLQLLFARWMGPSEFGEYTYLIGWSTIAAVLTGLGLATAVLRFVPAYAAEDDWQRLRGLLRMSMLGTCIASGGVAIAGTAIVAALHSSHVVGNWNALIALWMIPLFSIMTVQQEAARAFRRIGLAYAPSLVLRPLLAIVGAGAYVALGGQLESTIALAVTLGAMALAVCAQAFDFWRRLEDPVRVAPPRYETRRWLRTALPLLLVASFVVILLQTDVVMVGAIMGHRAAGLYGAAAKTASLVGLVLIAVSAIAAPVFSSLFVQGRHDDLQRLVATLAHWIFWPSLLISLFLAVFAKPVLGLFGAQFASASSVLVILLVGQVINAGAGSVGWLLLVTGNQDQAAWAYGWSAAVHVALLAIMIPLLGIDGAALATTVSYSLWNVWLHSLVVRRLNVHPSILYGIGKGRSRPATAST
jgi:O-antigen/teichoic acid export membrane protein